MAIKANLIVDQGTTFVTTLNLAGSGGSLDLTGYTVASQLRKHYLSSNSVSFTATLNTNTNVLSLALNANTTSDLVAGRYVYDVELTNVSGEITRIVEGVVTVTPNVTR